MRSQRALPVFAAFSILCVMPSSGLCQSGDCDVDTITINGTEVMYVQGQLLVRPVVSHDIFKLAGELNATVRDSIPRIGWYRLMLPQDVDAAALLPDVQSSPGVQACELHGVVSAGDSESGNAPSEGTRLDCPPPPGQETEQWPLTVTRAAEAWSRVPPNSDVLIAILDSGCDTDHPEYASSPRIHYGFDWYDGWSGTWPEDMCGHGTHRLGELMAPAGNGGVAGTNQNCQVRVDKVFDDNPDPEDARWSTYAVAAALEYVVFAEGARVVSMSFSGGTSNTPGLSVMHAAFCDVNANAVGTVILCCAGNGSVEHIPITYPAAWSCELDCVMAIGGSTEEDELWIRTRYLDLYGYGGQLSLLAPGEDAGSYCTTALGGGYDDHGGGTSGATAHAAGIAGMLISKYPWMVNHRIKMQLQNTSTMIAPPSGYDYDGSDCWGHPCWCIRMGSGRIDAVNSLNLRYNRQCPSFKLGGNVDDELVERSAAGSPVSGEVSVYDLLGRRLYAAARPSDLVDLRSVERWLVDVRGLPAGPKIVRIVTPNEVRTWRIVP